MSNVKAKSIFDKMVEANIEITNLAYENKEMAKFLNLMGLSTDDITDNEFKRMRKRSYVWKNKWF